MKVVISQPMFFPWVGMFEQIRLAEIYVHYADIQFSKGSFVNRVQVKTASGIKWLSVPLKGLTLGQCIDEVEVNNSIDWRRSHLQLLTHAYAEAPFREDMLAIVRQTYDAKPKTIDELAIGSLEIVLQYFELAKTTLFINSKVMRIDGSSSQRVVDIVRAVGGDTYITGHGAKNYLDHDLFEHSGIRVEYMDYLKINYPQLHGTFTPYVSILDLIANQGKAGKAYIHSGTRYWKDCV